MIRNDSYCICGNFTAPLGDAFWVVHFARCPDVAPWIRAWAARRIDGPGPAVVQPQQSFREEAPIPQLSTSSGSSA